MSNSVLNLIDYTVSTYFKELCFKPYLRLYDIEAANLLYLNSALVNSIINIFPACEEDSNNIKNGYCFIVFDNFKLAPCIEDFKKFVTYYNRVEDTGVVGMIKQSNSDISVISFKLKPKYQYIFNHYLVGNYTKMFSKIELRRISGIFERPAHIGHKLAELKSRKYYDDALHILWHSMEYEKLRAADLGVSYLDFKGSAKEAMSPIDIEDETLNIASLIRQLKKLT